MALDKQDVIEAKEIKSVDIILYNEKGAQVAVVKCSSTDDALEFLRGIIEMFDS